MKAAVVNDTIQPPAFADFKDPVAASGETIVKVRFAALSSLAKGQAAGRHYSSRTTLPFVPGVDGVGEREDGRRVFFAFPTAPFGSMAEYARVREAYCIPLDDALDGATAAAAANPGMSSFAALTLRANLVPGESVLINGATGVSGRLAVQIAKFLGAKNVVATGRNRAALEHVRGLGADATIDINVPPEELTATFARELRAHSVNVILDYLWGKPASAIIDAIAGHGAPEGEPRIRFVQIGSSAGGEATIAAKAIRSSGLEVLGSGLGSIAYAGLLSAIGRFFEAYVSAGFTINTEVHPLEDVRDVWEMQSENARLVLAVT